MDEAVENGRDRVPAAPLPDLEPTGVESVDRVLTEVAALADCPVAEHVAVFEGAHEQLRRALDATPASPVADERGA